METKENCKKVENIIEAAKWPNASIITTFNRLKDNSLSYGLQIQSNFVYKRYIQNTHMKMPFKLQNKYKCFLPREVRFFFFFSKHLYNFQYVLLSNSEYTGKKKTMFVWYSCRLVVFAMCQISLPTLIYSVITILYTFALFSLPSLGYCSLSEVINSGSRNAA